MRKLIKKILACVLSGVVIFGSLTCYNWEEVYAEDFSALLKDFMDLSEVTEANEYNYSLIISTFKADGASDEVVAGLMCNIKAEAASGIYAIEGYWGGLETTSGHTYSTFEDGGTYDYADVQPHWTTSGGDEMGGAGHGIVQWTYREKDLEDFYNQNKSLYQFVTITHWIRHWASEGTEFSGKRSKHTCHLADIAGQVAFLLWDLTENRAELKKEFYACTSAAEAAKYFCINYEVPSDTQVQATTRAGYADDAMKLVKACPQVSGKPSPGVSQSTQNMVDSFLDTGLWGEEEFVKFSSLAENAIELADRSDLSYSERSELSNWKQTIDYSKQDNYYHIPRTVFMFIGIIIVIYSVVLYLAFQFDKVNNFIDIELLNMFTLGRLRASVDETSNYADHSAKNKVVKHKDMIKISLVGIVIGVLLISGKLFNALYEFIMWLKGVF